MKIICIEDQHDTGVFRTKMKKIDGLTKGHVYQAMLFSNASGQTTSTSPKFFIFNDNDEWKTYSVKLFKPYEVVSWV